MNTEGLKNQVNNLLAEEQYDKIKQVLLANKEITEHDNDLAITCYLCTIYEKEAAAGKQTIFTKVQNLDELIERYTVLKFHLRRIDFGFNDDDLSAFYQFLTESSVSSFELLTVMEFCVINKQKVLEKIRS